MLDARSCDSRVHSQWIVRVLWNCYELTFSWERKVGRSCITEAVQSPPGVWLFPGDSVCWLILICFVSLLLLIAEQIVVMLLWGDVAVLGESFYPSSTLVFLSIAWWIDKMAQTFNKYSKWWCKRNSWTTWDGRIKSLKKYSQKLISHCCYFSASRAWLRPHFFNKDFCDPGLAPDSILLWLCIQL